MGESDVLHGRFCQPDLDDGVLWELGEIGPEEGGVDALVARYLAWSRSNISGAPFTHMA